MEHLGDAHSAYAIRLAEETGDGHGGVGDLAALTDWLREDPHVGRTTRLDLISPPPEPSELGTLLDAIAIVAASGFSTASLVVAVRQFRALRPGPAITIERPGGRRVTVTGASVEEVRRLVEELERTEDSEPGEGER